MTRSPLLGALLGLLLVASGARAEGVRFRIDGAGPEGPCDGTALLAAEPGGALVVTLKTVGHDGAERRGRAEVARAGGLLSFTLRAARGVVLEPALSARCRRLESGALEVVYRDERGAVVRRETWTRDEEVTIPVLVVALTGEPFRFPDVTPEEALQAQASALAQLNRVYAPGRLRFVAISAPELIAGAPFDTDGDGRLSRDEGAALRADLEARELKRPGRVVLVLTAAPIIGRGCRGWTLGDARATPHSLGDVNDNFSLVSLRFVANGRTVPHEVGHQLGLDDLTPHNRDLLDRRDRADHLMESGGGGAFLDPALMRVLRRTVRWPDHGLEGRRPLEGKK
ncbi:MAG: hypothetical protein M9894_08645 [Planctomycetes bacterium]|nr:hypothetical protein [Planctomycetota bacterium]